MIQYRVDIHLVNAQEDIQVRLAAPETGSFPRITSFLDVRDSQGKFMYGLEKSDINVIEDGIRLPLRELNMLHNGVQFVLAINPGASFAIRDVQGLSRYDYVVQALQTWVEARQGSSLDDLSLLAVDGPEATHLNDLRRWLATLKSYQLNARDVETQFDLLDRALEVAADTPDRPGMGRAVLYLTAPPEQDISLGLQSLASRARERDVKVYVWLVASSENFASQGASQLVELASQTGGEIFYYSGQEVIPNLEDYLEPLRNSYYMAYDSRITSSGTHSISVIVRTGQLEISSPEREFEIQVLPPDIAFISPQQGIQRSNLEEDLSKPLDLSPKMQLLEVLIEFPDGHQRPIRRTILYVDGNIVDENTSHPFDRFSWSLKEYTTTGQHILKAEVVDSLGLKNVSINIPVMVTIATPKAGFILTIARNRQLLAGVSVAVAGVILLLVLIMGGRITPGVLVGMRRRRRKADPVTQPVRVKLESSRQRLPDLINRIHWPRRKATTKALAFLTKFNDPDEIESDSSPPIPIIHDELTFGSDPTQATQVLTDPSLEALHARLRHLEDGTFRLSDEGSVSGTWINYTPVSKEGAIVQHGDLIHFGRVGFRFTMRDPKQVRKLVITPEKPEE